MGFRWAVVAPPVDTTWPPSRAAGLMAGEAASHRGVGRTGRARPHGADPPKSLSLKRSAPARSRCALSAFFLPRTAAEGRLCPPRHPASLRYAGREGRRTRAIAAFSFDFQTARASELQTRVIAPRSCPARGSPVSSSSVSPEGAFGSRTICLKSADLFSKCLGSVPNGFWPVHRAQRCKQCV